MNKAEEYIYQHAWNYFEIHAKQRLTTFNFYITLSTFVAAGLFTALSDDYRADMTAMFLSFLLLLLSFVFWKLDKRNRELIHSAERALIDMEENLLVLDGEGVSEHKLFSKDENRTKYRVVHNVLGKMEFSYSDCFNTIFMGFGLTALAGEVLAVFHIMGAA